MDISERLVGRCVDLSLDISKSCTRTLIHEMYLGVQTAQYVYFKKFRKCPLFPSSCL